MYTERFLRESNDCFDNRTEALKEKKTKRCQKKRKSRRLAREVWSLR
jgi:hypothetical protein